MTITFKTASLQPTRTEEVIYTVPANTNAAIMNAIATVGAGSKDTSLGVRPNGSSTTNWLVNGISMTASAATNMIAGDTKLMVGAGDTVRVMCRSTEMFDQITISAYWTTSPVCSLTNGSGTICIAHAASGGIYTTTDGGVTFTQTLAGITFNGCGIYISGTYYFYVSTSLAYKSTDGVTWSTQAVTNAPNVTCNFLNSVIQNGSTYAGLNTSTQMVTSSDGITWSNVGSTFAAAVNTLCWTGTNYVAGRSTTANPVVAYTSTDGASWASNTIVAVNSACTSRAVANNGGTVLLHTNSSTYYSTDHGVTWNTASQSGEPRLYTASKFLYSTGIVSSSGLPGSYSVAGASEGITSNIFVLDSSKIYAWTTSASSKVCSSPWTPRGGIEILMSLVELT